MIDLTSCLHKETDKTWICHHNGFILRSAYQPIFAFKKGRVVPVACEALLRIQRGNIFIMPGAFFQSLAEKERAHIEVASRTIHVRNAVHLPKQMRRLFINFDPSILASPSTFEASIGQLSTEVTQAGLTPSDVVCEITEQNAGNGETLNYFVYALRARGYKIAIDDFGAVASNPERVKALTPDIVKIDGRLTRRLMLTPEGFRLLHGMLKSFHIEGIQTVIEGIERPWQVELAETSGARHVQGFALARPRLAPADFSDWLPKSAASHIQVQSNA